MTPFQELRLWMRRAPGLQRITAGIAAAAALALLGWLAFPESGPSVLTSGQTPGSPLGQANAPVSQAPGLAGGQTGSGNGPHATATTAGNIPGSSGGVVPGTSGGATGPGPGGPHPTASSGSRCAPGADTGVSGRQVKIAIILADIKAGGTGNSAFGIPTPEKQQSMAEAVISDINAAGGVACRQLVPMFYTGDTVDSNQLQQTCQDIAGAGVFATLDFGAYTGFPSLAACYGQRKIPFFEVSGLSTSLTRQYYPYLFGGAALEVLHRDTVLALKTRGFFDAAKGFKKLGYFYSSCNPGMVTLYTKLLTQTVPSSQIVTYDMGCNSPFAPPSAIQQAVLKFQQNGVTHVTEVQDFPDLITFTNVAQQNGFKPQYGIPDENQLGDAITGATHPNYDNIANLVAITTFRDGEQTTPGNRPTAGTVKCNAVMKAHGLPGAYEQAGVPGGVCALLYWFADAANHARSVQRAALVEGLRATGVIDFSFPLGVGDFRASGETNGGGYWRPIQFVRGCTCFHVLAPFKASL